MELTSNEILEWMNAWIRHNTWNERHKLKNLNLKIKCNRKNLKWKPIKSIVGHKTMEKQWGILIWNFI